jgi:hypothetical protein
MPSRRNVTRRALAGTKHSREGTKRITKSHSRYLLGNGRSACAQKKASGRFAGHLDFRPLTTRESHKIREVSRRVPPGSAQKFRASENCPNRRSSLAPPLFPMPPFEAVIGTGTP